MPAVADPSTVNLGRIKSSTPTIHRTVSIFRGDGAPIKPEIQLGRLPNVDAQLCEIEPGEHYELEISVSPPFIPGRLHDRIIIHTGVDEVEFISVGITAIVPQRLTLIPGQVLFPLIRRVEMARTVNLTWDGPPGNIVGATTTLPGATVSVIGTKKKPVVKIVLESGENEPKATYQLALETDDPVTGTRTIPIRFINLNQDKNTGLARHGRRAARYRAKRAAAAASKDGKAPSKKPQTTGSSGQR